MIKERAERICQEGFTRAKHGWFGVMMELGQGQAADQEGRVPSFFRELLSHLFGAFS